MLSSRFLLFSRSFSSSALVSEMISSSSDFFTSRSVRRSKRVLAAVAMSACLVSRLRLASLIFLFWSSTSSDWNSISLLRLSYSRLFLTSLSCAL